MTSDYLLRPKRDLCPCGRGPKRAVTEMCRYCEDDAQTGVVNLDQERAFRDLEKAMEGKT